MAGFRVEWFAINGDKSNEEYLDIERVIDAMTWFGIQYGADKIRNEEDSRIFLSFPDGRYVKITKS